MLDQRTAKKLEKRDARWLVPALIVPLTWILSGIGGGEPVWLLVQWQTCWWYIFVFYLLHVRLKSLTPLFFCIPLALYSFVLFFEIIFEIIMFAIRLAFP